MAYQSFWEKYDKCDSVCVPVNCKGVMGAGLAKALKDKMSPEEVDYYLELCKTAKPGESVFGFSEKFIYCFTKNHWGYPTLVTWVESCLQGLILLGSSNRTLLLPRLGCGLGGLRWDQISHLYDVYVPRLGFKEVYLV